MKLKTYLIAAILLLAGAFLIMRQRAQKPVSPLGTTLRLGISADNPPFTMVKNGKITGFEIDLAQALATELTYNLDILDLDFSGLIAAVKNDVIDLAISGFEITEERKKNIDFSDPYYSTNIAIIAHQSVTTPNEFASGRIGVQHGSTFETAAKKLQAQFPSMAILGFHRTNQAVQELEQNTIDLILIDAATAAQITTSHPALIASPLITDDASNGLGAIFKKGSPLVQQFNGALATLKANGTLQALTKKWLSTENKD